MLDLNDLFLTKCVIITYNIRVFAVLLNILFFLSDIYKDYVQYDLMNRCYKFKNLLASNKFKLLNFHYSVINEPFESGCVKRPITYNGYFRSFICKVLSHMRKLEQIIQLCFLFVRSYGFICCAFFLYVLNSPKKHSTWFQGRACLHPVIVYIYMIINVKPIF